MSNLKEENFVVSLDLSSVKADLLPGVSEPCPAFGLSLEEIEEIVIILGQSPKLRVLTISEYNPAIEKFKSGSCLNRIWNSLLVGLAKQKQ